MPRKAWLFVISVLLAGALVLVAALGSWNSPPPLPFALAASLGLLVSACKVRLPGLTGTISGGFGFVLFVAAVFDWQATVVLALLAALVQSLWRTQRRPAWYQIAFNAANIVLCAGFANGASAHLSPRGSPAQFAAAGLLLFLANTLTVSTVLCLTGERPLRSVWETCQGWAAPYYLAGGLLAGAMAAGGPDTALLRAVTLAAGLAVLSCYYRKAVGKLEAVLVRAAT